MSRWYFFKNCLFSNFFKRLESFETSFWIFAALFMTCEFAYFSTTFEDFIWYIFCCHVDNFIYVHSRRRWHPFSLDLGIRRQVPRRMRTERNEKNSGSLYTIWENTWIAISGSSSVTHLVLKKENNKLLDFYCKKAAWLSMHGADDASIPIKRKTKKKYFLRDERKKNLGAEHLLHKF